MAVFAVAAIEIAPNPTNSMAIIARGNTCTAAAATSATPITTAPPAMIPVRERLENAIPRAATSDPRPDAAIRKPNPVASVCRTSWASAGMITLKFMAKVEATPTTIVASRTTSVPRTYRRPSASVVRTSATLWGRIMRGGEWRSSSRITA